MFVKELVRCRLCRQLSLTVFVVGIAVATPVLLFSAHHLRNQQLESFDREVAARVAGLTARPMMAGTSPDEGPARLAEEITASKLVVGGRIVDGAGTVLREFGEKISSDLIFRPGSVASAGLLLGDDRYETVWPPERIGGRWAMVARLDVAPVNMAFFAFIERAAAIAFIIVTLAAAAAWIAAGARGRLIVLAHGNGRDRRHATDRREREAEDIASLARIPEESPSPMIRVALDATVLYRNSPAGQLMNFWRIDVGGRLPSPWRETVIDVIHARHAMAFELRCGDSVFALLFQPIVENGYVNIYGHDITDSKATEERAQHMTSHDALTGLPNRALFRDRLEQVLRQARRARKLAAVHLVDFDHFKEINDSLGHTVGDELLKTMAGRIKDCVRESDTVARLGADEFAIIQVDPTDADGVAAMAQKVMGVVAPPVVIGGHTLHCSATIGLTVFPDDSDDAQEILRNADLALFHAKAEARGTYRFFVAAMNETIQRRRAIESDLRMALEREEFMLYYQPKLNIVTNRITGMEALIRWRHPEQGFLSPAEFIPIAERSRLIVPIGAWALAEACRQVKAWQDARLPGIKVAVNLSAVQFREKDLVQMVEKTLLETGLDSRFLEIEITEGVAMNNAIETIDVFDALAGLGVSLSIDDFGTGYSSLSYLKNFPVQRIKIDKAFVDDIGTDKNPGAIAKAITTLGHSFGMEITAEGVETESQLAFLQSLGCDEIQGYFFSRPLNAKECRRFIDDFDQTQPAVAAVARYAKRARPA